MKKLKFTLLIIISWNFIISQNHTNQKQYNFGINKSLYKFPFLIFYKDTLHNTKKYEGKFYFGDVYLYKHGKEYLVKQNVCILVKMMSPHNIKSLSLKTFLYKNNILDDSLHQIQISDNEDATILSYYKNSFDIDIYYNENIIKINNQLIDLESGYKLPLEYKKIYFSDAYLVNNYYKAHIGENIVTSKLNSFNNSSFGLLYSGADYFSPFATLPKYIFIESINDQIMTMPGQLKDCIQKFLVQYPIGIPDYLKNKKDSLLKMDYICIDENGIIDIYAAYNDYYEYKSELILLDSIDLFSPNSKQLRKEIFKIYEKSNLKKRIKN